MTPAEIAEMKKRKEIKAKREADKLAYINALKEETERMEKERKEAKEAMKGNKDATHNIMLAEYKYCFRLGVDKEVNIPPANVFIPIGYDKARAISVEPILNLENKAENLEK